MKLLRCSHIASFVISVAAVVATTSTVAAASGPSASELVEQLSQDYQIQIENEAQFATEDLQSLVRGAEVLPPQLWDMVDGDLTVEYIARACLFSMGRYNERCQTFKDGDRRHFYIYDSTPVTGEGPVEQLKNLSKSEQRDLQLRRAIIHLVMVHVDEKTKWSDRKSWKAINGWRGTGRALNHDPWGYSRYMGMRSAHLDLVTFAEEYFVRPEDLLIEGIERHPKFLERLSNLDPNQTVTCQQFTRRRVLGNNLRELDDQWSEPVRQLPHLEAGEPMCPAFEQWARPEQVAGFDILLAAATSGQPESLFGHLLLHVRYETDGTVRGEGFEPVYQFGAITATDVDTVEYFTRGLLGGFPSILEMTTFRGVDRLFLQYQQRNLRRYTLNLDETQSRQFLERIWEAERRIRYPYLFLTDNCASFILDLLAPAIDLPVPARRGPVVMPTDVLDALADIDNGEMGPLLEKRPDTLRSNLQVAEEAVAQRRVLRQKLVDAAGDDHQLRQEIEAIADGLATVEPSARHEVYQRAEEVFDRLLAKDSSKAHSVIDFLYHSVLIERYFMEMAHFAQRAVYIQAHGSGEPRTIDDQLEHRRRIYGTEDLQERIAALNELAGAAEQALVEGPTRELTEEEQMVLKYEERTRKSYIASLQLQAGLTDRYMPDWSGVEYLDDRSQAYLEERKRLDARSEGPSGRTRIVVGGGWEPELERPEINFSYSLVEDRIGEVRRRGYHGDLGTRILGLDAAVPVMADAHKNLQLDLTLLKYESLERTQGPLTEGLFSNIGWAVDTRIVHDGRRDLFVGAELSPSLLFPLWTASDEVHHLVAHMGLGVRYDVHIDQNLTAGPTAGVFAQFHLYGSYVNVLRLGAETGHFFGGGPQWLFDAKGRVESRHVILRRAGRAMVLVPFVEGLWTTRDYREDAPEEGFQTWQGGLQLELPF